MHIDILTPNRWVYTYESYAASKLSTALKELGCSHRHLAISDGSLFSALSKYPSAWIVTFSNLGEQYGRPTFLWESLQLAYALSALEHGYTRAGFFDPSITHPNISFLPHAVDVQPVEKRERSFDVVVFDDYLDLTRQERSWELVFGTAPSKEAEMMIAHDRAKALWVEELIGQTEIPFHLFGEHVGHALLRRLPQHVALHGPLSHLDGLEMVSMSKILISHQMTQGYDAWFLPAIFSGCLVLTNETPLLKEMVGNQVDIFYTSFDHLQEKVRYFLAHPEEREEVCRTLQKRFAAEHGWSVRTEQLLNVLEHHED